MICKDMNVRKSHETAFIMAIQGDFQCHSLKSSLRHTSFPERGNIIEACDA